MWSVLGGGGFVTHPNSIHQFDSPALFSGDGVFLLDLEQGLLCLFGSRGAVGVKH